MAADKSARGGAGRGQGRKPIHGEAMKTYTFRATEAQHAQFLRLGGSKWIRAKIAEDSVTDEGSEK